MTTPGECCYADTVSLYLIKQKEVMAHETAQILGMGCRVLFHNGILYRIQTQVISRQQSSKKYYQEVEVYVQ